ncbi:MAG: thioesterase family protein [Bacteroidia bacterium]|nr:thioesterase family protein [Bacteroidia bacterium]NND26912.1 thioesterase family protein [Flavobacteriaceae bacterium]MBT8277795.1 thioesterase family protein [Bacteroidia bacterium]NNK61189.1 thioesterase family protein [Flavobacteriaceae bacterium]NNL31786.1 thioesterase family protein [Flavobacteriaceae bacterium]
MYLKEFDIRWRDIDANMHLGNSSYVDFMSHTRMTFLIEMGLDLSTMKSMGLGPIVFYEHIYYFKELRLGQPVRVSLEVAGMSEDGRFIKFEHNFYNQNGRNLAYSEMLFSWIDLKTRKLGNVSENLLEKIKTFPKAAHFKILTKEDTRKYGKRPQDLN